jgi:D-glycero-alpha-D-manno-heptose-7-phosphate kinase
MIITHTPFRISFFGGSTDYPVWYREHPGAVLATAIDKYCLIVCRKLPPFFEYRHRIVYRTIEMTNTVDEIQHPSVRECMKFLGIEEGIHLHHDGDLPARAGMGTSSAFTVGLLHSLYALKGIMPRPMQLAKDAIHIEQDVLHENVGSQDQVTAAIGGFNRLDFSGDEIQVSPMVLPKERLEHLEASLMLYFTGFARTASQVAKAQIEATPGKKSELCRMYEMVTEAVSILNSDRDLNDFGKLLHESWMLKKSLTKFISTPYTDYLYERALGDGAIGGKMLGAGGGGFMLLFVEPEKQAKVMEDFRGMLRVPFRFSKHGSEVIYSSE